MAKIAAVKGTRDFYPAEMAVRNWIEDGWRQASLRSGFVEYDGPIFEHLQLFTEKSGEAIAGELFSLTDRGGRDLAIRPEMTPTLARMVNQRINALARPIKWFSLARCCRAERPQRGRLREFFQWNIDIIGADSLLADAECIFTAVDYLRSVGLTSKDVVVKFSSRSLLAALLGDIGFAEDQFEQIYALLDKRPKLPPETFAALAEETIADPALGKELLQRLDNLQPENESEDALERLSALAQSKNAPPFVASHDDPLQSEVFKLETLKHYLEKMGIYDYCEFDINIVRGLAYYTGPVYEVFDRSESLRAVAAGGRYDNLLAGLGGPQVSGTGFGMGDAVLGILLEKKRLLRAVENRLDFFVIATQDGTGRLFEDRALPLVNELRRQGFSTAFDYRRSALGKQLKQAAAQNARYALILDRQTLEDGIVKIKDMDQGSQSSVPFDEFLANPRRLAVTATAQPPP